MAIGGGIAAGQWLQRDDDATLPTPTLGLASDLPLAEGPVQLLVDTDVAPDDLVAIAFLVAAPDVSIRAISVSGTGEVRCDAGVRIVLGLLDRLEAPQIPVACGREEPLALGHAFPDAFRENAERAAGLDLPISSRQAAAGGAVELITSSVRDADASLRILTLGPLTNLAEAFDQDATLAASVEAVYVMGGAVDVPGNVAGSPDAPSENTTAEWNIYADPAAAQIVLGADVEVFLIGLDGTSQVPVTSAFVDRVISDATGTGLEILAELVGKNPYMTGGDYYLWDPLAAIAAAGYPIGEFTSVRLTVDESDGPTSGATQRTDGAPNAKYLSAVDAPLVENLMISILNAE
ncbi:MAG: nucleoside hydrolase, partial [Candidatus Limnocylindria bacterium]